MSRNEPIPSRAHRVDVLVHGAGIVGCAAALALRRAGLRVAIEVEPVQGTRVDGLVEVREDVRAYAINARSQGLLDSVGAWALLPPDARTPVYDMHVVGDHGGSALDFSAWQQHVRELAWIVDASTLEAGLRGLIDHAPVERVAAGDVDAALRVVAEGKVSATRDALGVRFERHAYGQTAVAARLVSDRRHAHTARQWFLAPDILALLPLDRPEPGHSFGLVWSVSTQRASELHAMPVDAFEHDLNQATQGRAGQLRLGSTRAAWPLAVGRAERVVGPGWALVGDAAHLVHPLAGQGLNLGLGDVAALADVLAAREAWRSVGDERLLSRYARQRAWPVASMRGATDALQMLFAHPSPVARELRNRGLGLVDSMSALKRWLASEALGR